MLIIALLELQAFMTKKVKRMKPGGGGGNPLYKPFRYVPPHRVGFFAPFWSENGHTLGPFWSGIGYGFRGNYRVSEPIDRFNSK